MTKILLTLSVLLLRLLEYIYIYIIRELKKRKGVYEKWKMGSWKSKTIAWLHSVCLVTMHEEEGYVLYRESYIALFAIKMHNKHPCLTEGMLWGYVSLSQQRPPVCWSWQGTGWRLNEKNGWEGQSAFLVLLSSWTISETRWGTLGPIPSPPPPSSPLYPLMKKMDGSSLSLSLFFFLFCSTLLVKNKKGTAPWAHSYKAPAPFPFSCITCGLFCALARSWWWPLVSGSATRWRA